MKPTRSAAIVGLVLIAQPSWSAESTSRNQASAAETVILPAEGAGADAGPQRLLVEQVRRVLGVNRLAHVALVEANVDPDGCMTAPLAVRALGDDRRSDALDALASALKRRGVVVTLLSVDAVRPIDQARQRLVHAAKDSSSLSFDEGEGRWFATKAELVACAPVDPDETRHRTLPHAALAAELADLHQDVVLAVGDNGTESKGPSWNVIVGELSGDGKNLDVATSSAKIAATMVLKNGSIAWSGEGVADGRLRPPLDEQAVQKLKAFMEAELRLMGEHRETGPAPAIDEKKLNAIASGDLDESPAGSTLGPSAAATLQAAAERVVQQLAPVLPGR